MEQIFNTFPAFDKWAISWDSVSSFFPFTAVLSVTLVLAFVLTITGFFSLVDPSHGNERENKTDEWKFNMLFGWALFGAFLVLGGLLLILPYNGAEDSYEEKSENLLDISIYRDWYVKNAQFIDEKLTAKDFEYLDLNYDVPYSLSKKEELYFGSIGYKREDVVIVDVTDRQGKHSIAHVKVVGGVKDKKHGTLVLKNTSEFGEEYAFGERILYGTIYVE